MDEKEILVILLKNETGEIRLRVFVLEDGKASTIFKQIKEVINKFDL